MLFNFVVFDSVYERKAKYGILDTKKIMKISGREAEG